MSRQEMPIFTRTFDFLTICAGGRTTDGREDADLVVFYPRLPAHSRLLDSQMACFTLVGGLSRD